MFTGAFQHEGRTVLGVLDRLRLGGRFWGPGGSEDLISGSWGPILAWFWGLGDRFWGMAGSYDLIWGSWGPFLAWFLGSCRLILGFGRVLGPDFDLILGYWRQILGFGCVWGPDLEILELSWGVRLCWPDLGVLGAEFDWFLGLGRRLWDLGGSEDRISKGTGSWGPPCRSSFGALRLISSKSHILDVTH